MIYLKLATICLWQFQPFPKHPGINLLRNPIHIYECTLNNHGDITQPYLNPTLTGNNSLTSIPIQTRAYYLHRDSALLSTIFLQLHTLLASATLSQHYHIQCRLIVLYAFFKLIPKYIFPIHWLLFTHLPYSKHFINVPSTLLKPILLLPYFTFSYSPNFFNQHSTTRLTKYTKKLLPFELLHSYLSLFPFNRGSYMHHPVHRYDPHIRPCI